MSLELYHLKETDSFCSNEVISTLKEKGISDWTAHRMSEVNRDQFKPEYLKINPKRVVPAHVHDGRVSAESNDILHFLEETFPEQSFDEAVRQWRKKADWEGMKAKELTSGNVVKAARNERAGQRAIG